MVATAGTTNAGIVDDLAGVAAVASERDLWFHVDAAYGGAALFAPSVRDRFEGIEHADSLIVDPHKWLFAPFDCAALLYREPRLAKAVHTQDAAYLDVLHDADHEAWNPSDYAVHLTTAGPGAAAVVLARRPRHRRVRDAVETVLETAQTQRRAHPTRLAHVELVPRPRAVDRALPSRRLGPGRLPPWSVRLLLDQVAFVTPTTWEGEPVARLAFLHPDTTVDMVAEILATMA